MSDYIKQLEEQNEELKQKLSIAEMYMFRWVKEDFSNNEYIKKFSGTSDWWYMTIGKETILAVVHHVKDATVQGYKICFLKTPVSFATMCNVECSFYETATCGSLENAQRYCEDKIING